MDQPYRLELEDAPDAEDVRLVRERLYAYNRELVGDDGHRPLAVFMRDAGGAIVGGLLGGTYWGWLHVEILWVRADLRGQGHGCRLLQAAEREAVKRGCRYAHLDTMSFQAPSFYERQGYAIYGELHDLPTGHTRHFMQKALGPDAAPAERRDGLDKLWAITAGYNRRFPEGDEPFQMMTRLLEECGELAQQVNQFEGSGVKRAKYGPPDKTKLANEVRNVLTCALQVAQHYGVESELEASLEWSYQRLKAEGFI